MLRAANSGSAAAGERPALVVAVSDEGTLVRWRAGAWELLAVPRSGRDPLVAVAIDARGRVVVAGATGGVHRLDGERWQTEASGVSTW